MDLQSAFSSCIDISGLLPLMARFPFASVEGFFDATSSRELLTLNAVTHPNLTLKADEYKRCAIWRDRH